VCGVHSWNFFLGFIKPQAALKTLWCVTGKLLWRAVDIAKPRPVRAGITWWLLGLAAVTWDGRLSVRVDRCHRTPRRRTRRAAGAVVGGVRSWWWWDVELWLGMDLRTSPVPGHRPASQAPAWWLPVCWRAPSSLWSRGQRGRLGSVQGERLKIW